MRARERCECARAVGKRAQFFSFSRATSLRLVFFKFPAVNSFACDLDARQNRESVDRLGKWILWCKGGFRSDTALA